MKTFFKVMMLAFALTGLAACSSTGGLQDEGGAQQAEVVDQSSGAGTTATTGSAATSEGAQTGGAEAPYSFEGRPIKGASDPSDAWLVYFDLDSSSVDGQYHAMLAAHAAYLAQHPDAQMTIEGHADERGSREYNIGLGERRARAVRDLMVLQGVAPRQLTLVSYGEERPDALGHDESAWRLNRRAVLLYTH